MENDFVPYELALELRELGFDEPCIAFYSAMEGEKMKFLWATTSINHVIEVIKSGIRFFDDSNGDKTRIIHFIINSFSKGTVTAPTFMQAFRFFRDRGIHNAILPKQTPSNTIVYYRYEGKVKTDWNNCFETYEEAEIASLNKLIAIYKTQRR